MPPVGQLKGYAIFKCGRPECAALVELPKKSLTASYPHRDKQGFRCNGLLVLMSQTPEGNKRKIDRQFQAEMTKRYAEDKKRADLERKHKPGRRSVFGPAKRKE